MAVERDFKIVRTVERLNRIIHESKLTTRFVSLFYGEIEDAGSVMYVNAGHPHPLHFHKDGVTPLVQTGLVLGPTPNATYARGYRHFQPGDALLLYTDGMVEAHGQNGEEFGTGRLAKAFLEVRDRPCDEIVRELVKRVDDWTGGGEPEDDRTVVVIKRHHESAPPEGERRTTGAMPKVVS
jgi:serine phosphatase RsbU (regulator of sigma subunit)